MYEQYWNLNARPFQYRMSPNELYRSKTQQSAALRLRYCIDNNAGAALLLGVSGVGKSSLLQQLSADEHLAPFSMVTFPSLTSCELLRCVAADVVHQPCSGGETTDALLLNIYKSLQQSSADGQHCVIAFDEAHLLSNECLNQVVLPLLNLADRDHRIQLTVILCGQPSLASHVTRNAQLKERIAVTAAMDRFTDQEVGDYIRRRMESVGATRQVFSDDAVDAIIQLSEGNPRRINRLCDMALLVGYADQISQITDTEIRSLSVEILPMAA
ncbi:MAG: AAA family ATPase [Planctomycetaceae bacterium]